MARHYFEPWEPREVDRSWLLWGSGMRPPSVATSPIDGHPIPIDDRRIVATIATLVADDPPTEEAVARRIVACVNACRGLIDPERAVRESRDLLADAVKGYAIDPTRVVRCLALLSPAVPARTEEDE